MLQRCGNFFALLAGASIRASVQSPTDFVSPCRTVRIIFLELTIGSGELDMTVNILIQVDKLVQLIESPVFTCEYCCQRHGLSMVEPNTANGRLAFAITGA